MTKSILIRGVPKSGKTTLAEKLHQRLGGNIIKEADVRNASQISGKTANDYKSVSEIIKIIQNYHNTDSDKILIIDDTSPINDCTDYNEILMNTITGDSSDTSVQAFFVSSSPRSGQDLQIDDFNYDSDSIVSFINNLP